MELCSRIKKTLLSESLAKDKGWSWLLLAGTFLINAYSWGVQHVVGIIYNVLIQEFRASKTLVAWITTIPLFLLYFLAPLFTILAEKVNGVRILGFIGALCLGLSLVTSSFIKNIYALLFTYSFLMGAGMLLLTTPCMIKVGEYFSKHKSFCLALTTTGGFISPLYLSPLLDYVISKYSWKLAFQVLGIQVLLICCPSVLLWRKHSGLNKNSVGKHDEQIINEIPGAVVIENKFQENFKSPQDEVQETKRFVNNPKENYSSINISDVSEEVEPYSSDASERNKISNFKGLLLDKNFFILLAACFVESIDWTVSHTFLVSYAVSLGIPTSKANWLPACTAAGNIIGRLLFGKLFDMHFIKTLTFYKVLLFATGIVSIFGAFTKSFEYLAVYTVVQMLFDGGHKSLMPTVVFEIAGEERLMEGWTLIMFSQSFTLILGAILVGILADLTENFKVIFYFISGPPVLASIILQAGTFIKE